MAQRRFERPKLSELPDRGIEVIREPSSTRPAVWLLAQGGPRAVVKDFRPNGFLYRNIVGRFLIWREKRAYRKLRGLMGVPKLYREIGGLALVFEQIQGRSLENLEKETQLSENFFKELRDLVTEVHERGLAHCDLKRAPNVLLGKDGQPYILDWSSAISQREFRFFPLKIIYRRFLLDDFNAITKLQLRHCPDTISPEEKERYQERTRIENLIRAIRDKGRSLLKKIS
jgi:tRNA A-37 threonylcarbamoyl transferase component Bud32